MKNLSSNQRRVLCIGVLGVVILAFHNCSFSDLSGSGGLSSRPMTSLESSGGGDGVPFGGKMYFRYVPEFHCEGKISPLATIQVVGSEITYSQNDAFICELSKKQLTFGDLDISPFQSALMGYQEGIFEHFAKTPDDIPANLAEVWCQATESPSDFEVIVHYDRVSRSALTRVMYADGATGLPREIQDFPVSRVIQDRQVMVRAPGFVLDVDRDVAVAGRPGEFEGAFAAVIDGDGVTKKLRCRLGGELDPKLWPMRVVSAIPASGQVKVSSSSQGPKKFALTSYALVDGKATSITDLNHLYVFSETPGSERRLDITGGTDTHLGFRDFQFSPDGRFVYFRSDQADSHNFALYQLDTSNQTVRQLPGKGLSGAGTNAIFDGGLIVASDGTLVYLTEVSSWGFTRLGYIPGTNPLGEPRYIDGGQFAGTSALYSYSAVHKDIVYFRATKDPSIFDLVAHNTVTGQSRVLLKESSLVGSGRGLEFGELLTLFKRTGIFPNLVTELFVLHPKTGLLRKFGGAPSSTASSPGWSWRHGGATDPGAPGWLLAADGTGSKIVRSDDEISLPDSFSINRSMFSRDKKYLWWEAPQQGGLFRTDALGTGAAEPICDLPEKAKVLTIIQRLSNQAVALVYREDLALLQIFLLGGGPQADCTYRTSMPLTISVLNGLLSAAVSPSGEIVVFTANIQKGSTTNFMGYAVPLSGETPIASTAAGLIYSYSSQIVFANDSTKAFLIFRPQDGANSYHVQSWEMPRVAK